MFVNNFTNDPSKSLNKFRFIFAYESHLYNVLLGFLEFTRKAFVTIEFCEYNKG